MPESLERSVENLCNKFLESLALFQPHSGGCVWLLLAVGAPHTLAAVGGGPRGVEADGRGLDRQSLLVLAPLRQRLRRLSPDREGEADRGGGGARGGVGRGVGGALRLHPDRGRGRRHGGGGGGAVRGLGLGLGALARRLTAGQPLLVLQLGQAEAQGRDVGGEGGAGRGGEVRHEPLRHADIHLGHGEEEGSGLLRGAAVPCLELLDVLQRAAAEQPAALGELVQVPHRQLQNVCRGG